MIFHIKILAELSSVLSQSTRLTDRRTAFSWLDRDACMRRGKKYISVRNFNK